MKQVSVLFLAAILAISSSAFAANAKPHHKAKHKAKPAATAPAKPAAAQ